MWATGKDGSCRVSGRIDALLRIIEYCRAIKELTLHFPRLWEGHDDNKAVRVFNVFRDIKCEGKVRILRTPAPESMVKAKRLGALGEALNA